MIIINGLWEEVFSNISALVKSINMAFRFEFFAIEKFIIILILGTHLHNKNGLNLLQKALEITQQFYVIHH